MLAILEFAKLAPGAVATVAACEASTAENDNRRTGSFRDIANAFNCGINPMSPQSDFLITAEA